MRATVALLPLLCLAALGAGPGPLVAQAANGVDDVAAVVATGLPVTAPDGSAWAFLRWEDTRSGSAPEPVALYRRQEADGTAVPLQLAAVVDPLGDVRTVSARLARTRVLGGDLTALEERLDSLFGGVLDPASGFGVADKLAAVALAAEVDADIRAQLGLLLRLFPAAAVALGRAALEPLTPGAGTQFELRAYDPHYGRPDALLGRVSVEGGAAFHLPAPGRPRALAEPSARGHLNVRLVWSVPPDLGARAFQQYGYAVYRVDSEYAVGQGWVGAPPAPGVLALMAETKPSQVARANALPILVETPLDEAGAAAVAAGSDPDAFLFADDHGRFRGGPGFADGDTFYYYVTARDLLGRDGLTSPGTKVIVCDRLPPPAPIRVRAVAVAVDRAGGFEQLIEVSWDVDAWARPEGPGDAAPVPGADGTGEAAFGGYHVYRFASIPAMQEALAADFRTNANRLTAAPLFPAAGTDRMTFVDDGSQAPHAFATDFPREGRDESRPWWYVVRALDGSSCGGNLSGPSAPVPGIIRDWTGPDGASGGISGRILEVGLVPPAPSGGFAPLPTDDPAPPGASVVCLTVQRTDPGVLWAEITQPVELGRLYFDKGNSVTWRYLTYDNKSVLVEAVAGAAGALPAQAIWSPPPGVEIPAGQCLALTFTASTATVAATPGGSRAHQPADPQTGATNCLNISVVALPADAREYKLYRRLGPLGPATLVAVGEIAPGTELLEIDACQFSPRGGDVCFAVQLFDQHGNPGPLTPLGCVPVLPTAPLPKPLLAKVEAGGTLEAPTALLEWFAPLPGIERFVLMVEDEGGEWPLEIASPWFRSATPAAERNESRGLLTFNWDLARLLEDGSLAPLPGTEALPQPSDGTGVVRLEVPVRTGVNYQFQVRAAGAGNRNERVVGPASEPQGFVWLAPQPELEPRQVPWPAEGRPGTAVLPGLEAVAAGPAGARYLALRIGRLTFAPEGVGIPMPAAAPYPLPAPTDPHAYLFRTPSLRDVDGGPEDTTTILPAVVYRYQVANELFPEVSGQLVQVTPLLRDLAWTANAQNADYPQFNLPASAGKDIHLLQDPYFRVIRRDPTPPPGQPTHDLLLLDPQPAVLGARYAYVVVRFTRRGEIFRLIPAGEITFTSLP